MMLLILSALAAAASAPSPLQYYSQALATMQSLPDPAYVSFQTNVTARGMGITDPCDKGKIRWSFGFGKQMRNHLNWQAIYDSANASETIHTSAGDVCSGPAETFDRPTWRDAYAWVRYGILSQTSSDTVQGNTAKSVPTGLKTIADVSVISPGAYTVTDGGAQRCPSGSQGHGLHFVPRFDSAKHPLRDAVVETKTMRVCMIRFDLGSYQAAGSGFRGDMRLDFGDVDGNWMITRGHAAMALRAVGLSLKNVVFEFWYTDVVFPQNASAALGAAH
jgi:hypothetical protein